MLSKIDDYYMSKQYQQFFVSLYYVVGTKNNVHNTKQFNWFISYDHIIDEFVSIKSKKVSLYSN